MVVDDPPYHAEDLMGFISAKLENGEAIKLTEEFSEIDTFDEKEAKQRQRVLSDFISLIERLITV